MSDLWVRKIFFSDYTFCYITPKKHTFLLLLLNWVESDTEFNHKMKLEKELKRASIYTEAGFGRFCKKRIWSHILKKIILRILRNKILICRNKVSIEALTDFEIVPKWNSEILYQIKALNFSEKICRIIFRKICRFHLAHLHFLLKNW